jgi:hypothetical protein
MSNAKLIRTLTRAAAALAEIAAGLQTTVESLSAIEAPAATPKKITGPKTEKNNEKVEGRRPGRQPAPRLKIKIVRDHWKMSFQEFDAAIRAAYPEVSGAQIKELKEELRAIKEEKGIEIKRGRPAATVEDAKVVRETPREKKPAAAVETPIKKIKNRAPKLDDSLTNF